MISDSADGAPVLQIKSAVECNDALPARMQTVGVNFDSSKVKRKVGKAKKEEGPMFLRKTYEMIDTCDQCIAEWSEDGQTFVVKDIDLFASRIIPKYFSHSNFSSFVRQLNFYGFRKIKVDPVRLQNNPLDIENKYWRFRHEKFLRGRPELIKEIKRRNQDYSATEMQHEVDSIRSDVTTLKDSVCKTSESIIKLKAKMEELMRVESCNKTVDAKQINFVAESKTRHSLLSGSTKHPDDCASNSFPVVIQEEVRNVRGTDSVVGQQFEPLPQKTPCAINVNDLEFADSIFSFPDSSYNSKKVAMKT